MFWRPTATCFLPSTSIRCREPDPRSAPPMKHVQTGSKVRVTGICFMNVANPFDSRTPFNILLRSPDDLAVIVVRPVADGTQSDPPGRSVVRGGVCRERRGCWMLRRRVRQQTAAITAQAKPRAAQERRIVQLEQWRSQILEDISGSQPLGEVVEHITEMVSFILNGAPCWCDVMDGPRLGTSSGQQEAWRDSGARMSRPTPE